VEKFINTNRYITMSTVHNDCQYGSTM